MNDVPVWVRVNYLRSVDDPILVELGDLHNMWVIVLGVIVRESVSEIVGESVVGVIAGNSVGEIVSESVGDAHVRVWMTYPCVFCNLQVLVRVNYMCECG